MFSNLISVFTPTTEPAVDAGPSTLVIKSNDINVTLFTEAKLVKMRERFPGQSDDTLARYLIARKDDYELACAQLDRAISWRAAHYPILKSTFMKELSTGKLYVRGVDKEGRPLLIYRSRLSFPKTRDLEECARMNIWFVEHIKRLMPNNMTKYTLLVDRTEHTSENTDIELMKHLSASVAVSRPYNLLLCRMLHSNCYLLFLVASIVPSCCAGPVPRVPLQGDHLPRRCDVLLDLGYCEVVRGPCDP